MARPSAMETSRRGSARDQPVRTSCTDSDRPKLGKSTKSGDGRSPRGPPSNHSQKKLGTRIADLESQLGLAQEELKCLKDHLATTDTGRKTAQGQVEKKPKKQQKVQEASEMEEKRSTPVDKDRIVSQGDESAVHKTSNVNDVLEETDVFEVAIEKVAVEEPKADPEFPSNEDKFEAKAVEVSIESAVVVLEPEDDPLRCELALKQDVVVLEPEDDPLRCELALKQDEINLLKANLSEKDKEMEDVRGENKSLKSKLDEKSEKISSSHSEIEELTSRLTKVVQELEQSKSSMAKMRERLEAAEKAKEELENEMTKLRVQTEQWRKAADAAASVLAGGVEMNGHRISERCGSMDALNAYERVGGMNEDCEYGLGSEKRKGSGGIRILGELWKKKGQK